MAHWLYLPNDAFGDLAVLAQTPPEKLEALRALVDSAEFRLQYKSYVKVAELLDISDESAAGLCTFLDYVQRQRNRNEQTGKGVLEELDGFVQRTAKASEGMKGDSDRIRSYLRENEKQLVGLFSELSEYVHFEKVRGLEQGPLPHLNSFRAYCDLRPVYDVAADEVVSWFPVITLHLVTHSGETSEMEEILVQLIESDLPEFRKQFMRLEKKLAKLRTISANFPTVKRGGQSK